VWQKVASPVWMDINPSDTLQYMSAREHDDERHICPLQLDVIRRGVMLWTNPNDIVLSRSWASAARAMWHWKWAGASSASN
jgi:DNA modification methylase